MAALGRSERASKPGHGFCRDRVSIARSGHGGQSRIHKKPLTGCIIVDTIKPVRITYDPAKSEKNAHDRGLPFSLVEAGFDWASAVIDEDRRKPYLEQRFQAIGFIGARLFVVVFTPIAGGVRVISFRKANLREVKRYEKATQSRIDR
jgi:hypothetical protein